MGRLAEELVTDRGGRKKRILAVPLGLLLVAAVAAFLLYRHFSPHPSPQEIIQRHIALIDKYEGEFQNALLKGLSPDDAKLVIKIMSRLDEAKQRFRAYSADAELEAAVRQFTSAAIELEVEMTRSIWDVLAGAAGDVERVSRSYLSESLPERIKGYYDRAKKDYTMLHAFGYKTKAQEARDLLGQILRHYEFSSAILLYREEVEQLFGDRISRRDIYRAKKIAARLDRFMLKFAGESPRSVEAVQFRAVSELRKHISDRLELAKRDARVKLGLIVSAYASENELAALYEYERSLKELKEVFQVLSLPEEEAQAEAVLPGLNTKIIEYEEIEQAEGALSAVHEEMVAFDENLNSMLVDGLDPKDARQCMAMVRQLDAHFVVFRHGEKEAFKEKHPNVLLMQKLRARIEREVGIRVLQMAEAIFRIRQEYSRSKDIDSLREELGQLKMYLKVLIETGRRESVAQAKVAIRDLKKRIDFLAHYDERTAILEGVKAQIQSLRLSIDSIFKDGLHSTEVSRVDDVRGVLERYKKYDPWNEGGIFTERADLVAYIDQLVNQGVELKANWVRSVRRQFFKSMSPDAIMRLIPEMDEAAKLFDAVRRRDLESEPLQLKEEMEYHVRLQGEIQGWRDLFAKLKDYRMSLIGRPTYGLQARDVKKLLHTIKVIQKETRRLEGRGKEPGANEEMIEAEKGALSALSTEMNQAIAERCDEAEQRYQEIEGSLAEMNNLDTLKLEILRLKEDYAVLKLRRPASAVAAKGVLIKTKKQYYKVKKEQERAALKEGAGGGLRASLN